MSITPSFLPLESFYIGGFANLAGTKEKLKDRDKKGKLKMINHIKDYYFNNFIISIFTNYEPVDHRARINKKPYSIIIKIEVKDSNTMKAHLMYFKTKRERESFLSSISKQNVEVKLSNLVFGSYVDSIRLSGSKIDPVERLKNLLLERKTTFRKVANATKINITRLFRIRNEEVKIYHSELVKLNHYLREVEE